MSDGKSGLRRKAGGWAVILLASVAGLFGGAVIATLYYQSASKNHVVVLSSADISRQGGQSISLTSAGEIYRQTCVGPCDQVSLEIWPRNQEFRVEIRGRAGECILCEPVYADTRSRHTIAGAQKLAVKYAGGSSY